MSNIYAIEVYEFLSMSGYNGLGIREDVRGQFSMNIMHLW